LAKSELVEVTPKSDRVEVDVMKVKENEAKQIHEND